MPLVRSEGPAHLLPCQWVANILQVIRCVSSLKLPFRKSRPEDSRFLDAAGRGRCPLIIGKSASPHTSVSGRFFTLPAAHGRAMAATCEAREDAPNRQLAAARVGDRPDHTRLPYSVERRRHLEVGVDLTVIHHIHRLA